MAGAWAGLSNKAQPVADVRFPAARDGITKGDFPPWGAAGINQCLLLAKHLGGVRAKVEIYLKFQQRKATIVCSGMAST